MDQDKALESAALAYIPIDWRLAMARGETLPENAEGAALFADISGFTPLTEALTQALGMRLGAEALSQYLDRVYDALINVIYRYGGSVIGFAGDSITCWFDNHEPRPAPPAGVLRAAACALQMQAVMEEFTSVPVQGREPLELKLKVSIASGTVRRTLVGNPEIQRFAVISGDTMARMAEGETLAVGGEILLDAPTVAALGEQAVTALGPQTAQGEAFTQLVGLAVEVPAVPWPPLPPGAITEEQYRPWLLPQIFERLKGGLGDFITEMRPVVALFLRFQGIYFDADPLASQKLDEFVRMVQYTLARYEGALMGVTVGDKGSYLYATFGAPIAHEDDARRALLAALAFLKLRGSFDWLEPVQVGISQGMVRTGAYGGKTRRTYGVLGDDVNLAARLMSQAAPGEILITGRIYKSVSGEGGLRAEDFSFEPRPPVPIKGKTDPLPVFAVTGSRVRRAMRLQEPAYALPMVGRQEELALIEKKIDLVLQGKGQVIGITANAGIGKSRLLAEAIRTARRKGLNGYGGACQADGTNTPFLVWKPIWQGIFNIDPGAPIRRQLRSLEGMLEDFAPDREDAMPLVGPLLGLSIPDNDFTINMDPQLRRMALVALLIDCLKNLANEEADEGGGLMLVLEDLHWIDPASLDLLEQMVRSIARLPVLVLLAYRPTLADVEFNFPAPHVAQLPNFTEISLRPLTPIETEQAVRAKLAQLYPEWRGAAPRNLIERIIEQAEGNPFYAEELLNYLHDQDMSLHDIEAAPKLELPSSLHALILSRLDQLTARQQLTLKVASIIGRLFRFDHLHGYYPALGESDPLRKELERMEEMELTRLETPEPELTYLFRHFITHEVAYENLPSSVRASLHEQYARYLEDRIKDGDATPYLDLLAHHYNLSNNVPKKRLYLRQAAAWAASRFANTEAFNYLTRALPLVPADAPQEKYELLVEREKVLDLMAVREVQRQDLDEMALLAETLDETLPPAGPGGSRRVYVALRRTSFLAQIGDYAGATQAAQQAIDWLAARPPEQQSPVELADLHARLGSALLGKGDFTRGQDALLRALEILPTDQPHRLHAGVFIELGILYASRGDLPRAAEYMHRGLAVCQQVKDELLAIKLRNNLGLVYTMTGDWSQALVQYNLALESANRMGVVKSQALTAMNMGLLYTNQGSYEQAMQAFIRSLELSRLAGMREGEVNNLINLARVALRQNDTVAAEAFLTDALEWATRLESYPNTNEIYSLRAEMYLAAGKAQAAVEAASQALTLARQNELEPEAGVALRLIGQARAALGQLEAAWEAFAESIKVLSVTDTYECARSKLLWAGILRGLGQSQQASPLLNEAHATFLRLGARADLAVTQKYLSEA